MWPVIIAAINAEKATHKALIEVGNAEFIIIHMLSVVTIMMILSSLFSSQENLKT
jgi:hypothetical protein